MTTCDHTGLAGSVLHVRPNLQKSSDTMGEITVSTVCIYTMCVGKPLDLKPRSETKSGCGRFYTLSREKAQ